MPVSTFRALLLGFAVAALLPMPAHAAAASQLAAAEVRVGVERMAKLHFEHRTSADRARAYKQMAHERDRVVASLATLRADKSLSNNQRRRLLSVSEDVSQFAEKTAGTAADIAGIYSDSEALAARISFLSIAVSGGDDTREAALLDLITRAAATAQRVGKIQLASAAGLQQRGLQVDTEQALIEFGSALQAIGERGLPEQLGAELELAQHQWIMLRAALAAPGAARDTRRLRDLATTSDRITESLLALARRALRPGIPGA